MDENVVISVGMPLPRIRSAEPLSGRRIAITWKDGRQQVIDVSPAILSHRGFIPLRTDDALFAKMQVDEHGDALVWPGEIELSATWIEELAPGSIENSEFRSAMDELGFTLDGMAARLGVARRLIADYRKNKPVPPAIALATRFLVNQRRRAG